VRAAAGCLARQALPARGLSARTVTGPLMFGWQQPTNCWLAAAAAVCGWLTPPPANLAAIPWMSPLPTAGTSWVRAPAGRWRPRPPPQHC
jgi:hypothetical protein